MTSARNSDNRVRAESFGSAADEYDRVRPSYPDQLIADLLDGTPRDALDIGCGTGKAARLLLARGVATLGIEIDERMAAVARSHGVTVETGAFEDWNAAGRQFDLATCGQAWHWVDPVAGPRKAAQVLRPGGRLALFWNFAELEAPLRSALDVAYAGTSIQAQSVVRGSGPTGVDSAEESLADSGLFGPVEHRTYDWDLDYPREDWLALISTHSDHSTLAAEDLTAVLDRVGAAIDSTGGRVRAHYRTHLLLTPVR